MSPKAWCSVMFVLSLILLGSAPWAIPIAVAGKLAIDGAVALFAAAVIAISQA